MGERTCSQVCGSTTDKLHLPNFFSIQTICKDSFQYQPPQLSADGMEGGVVLLWHFFCLGLPLMPAAAWGIFSVAHSWILSYWCIPKCSRFCPVQWFWCTPDLTCSLLDWCRVSGYWTWAGNVCTLWRVSRSSHWQLPFLLWPTHKYVDGVDLVFPLELALQSLHYPLVVLGCCSLLASSSWFSWDYAIPKYL